MRWHPSPVGPNHLENLRNQVFRSSTLGLKSEIKLAVQMELFSLKMFHPTFLRAPIEFFHDFFSKPNLLIEIYRLRMFLWCSHPDIKSYQPPKHTDILKNRSFFGNWTVFSRKSGIYSAVNFAKHNFCHKNTSETNSVSSAQYSNQFISMKNRLLPCFTTWSAEAALRVWARSLKDSCPRLLGFKKIRFF